MRVLVFGGNGMLGHKLYQVCHEAGLDVRATVRQLRHDQPDMFVGGVDAARFDRVEHALEIVNPTVVINCAGVVPRCSVQEGPAQTIGVNAIFPHWLYELCLARDIRMIHLSTDCVFSGKRKCSSGRCGRNLGYTESDAPDGTGLYALSKRLGETGSLILRTSFIGPEQGTVRGLLRWFLLQSETVTGYARHLFTGLTTLELSRVIVRVICKHQHLSGLYHVGGDMVTKYELLKLIKARYGHHVALRKDTLRHCDRRLASARFRNAAGYRPPPWPEMIAEMYRDDMACSLPISAS